MQRNRARQWELRRVLPWILLSLSLTIHLMGMVQEGLDPSYSDLGALVDTNSLAGLICDQKSNSPNLLEDKKTSPLVPSFTTSDSSINTTCPDGLVFVPNIQHNPNITVELSTNIPQRVFQTSKSKCVVPKVRDVLQKWQFEGWDYFLLDDDQVEEFFRHYSRDFPMLPDVAQNCLPTGTLKADLWRYLVLWEYGGVYADIDAIPNKLSPETTFLEDNHKDGLFVVEQYHLLSQYFMAVSPRHPLMWYAVQAALQKVLKNGDLQRINAAYTTGPHALHHALYLFADRDGAHTIVHPWKAGTTPVAAGTYVGTNGRSITALGTAANQNEFVNRDVLRGRKDAIYETMGMTHFSKEANRPRGRTTCVDAIFNLTQAKPPSGI